MGETCCLIGRPSSPARLSRGLSVSDNAGKARSGEASCIVTRCDEGPPRIVDAVGTVCPDAGFPVAVPGRAWRADGCSMAAPRFGKQQENLGMRQYSGDSAGDPCIITKLRFFHTKTSWRFLWNYSRVVYDQSQISSARGLAGRCAGGLAERCCGLARWDVLARDLSRVGGPAQRVVRHRAIGSARDGHHRSYYTPLYYMPQ